MKIVNELVIERRHVETKKHFKDDFWVKASAQKS
jgi:hypothetical protein